MGNLRTKDLSKIGYHNDQLRSLVIGIAAKSFKHQSKQEILDLLINIKNNPEAYLDNELTNKIAEKIIGKTEGPAFKVFELREEPVFCKTYGGKGIETSAKRQMELANLLPVSVQSALMPDAHMGFGLPIGGVLATDNAVIPYAVGMDIGCRMALSIIDESDTYLKRYEYQIKQALKNHTHFGMEGGLDTRQEHEVLDNNLFNELTLLKPLRGKAVRQLGTSGNGNHFVEFGEIEILPDNSLGLPAKKYTALLSHSGSRGLGSAIARHYTQLAMNTCKLPRQAQQLAWLDLNTEAGQEYWLAMTLAGDYAKACHERIHDNLLKALGLKALHVVENHHNFAWKDRLTDGREVIVHRKGATPAHAGELGIIPGSMTTAAYLVSGKGREDALFSASHGAGRAMSRQAAKDSMTVSAMKKLLNNAGVTLIGGTVEENPLAYKDIETVIAAQQELVSIEGRFQPRMVRMHKE
ncbi:tRNA-splicing ligase RtcB [Mucilaginibacter yixingensis]|uniref:3'-phosphate/5'-hydroxy nucleic acid ligase n=1 Tax=Mucilaginibacter yixingensis TaxID=1295612 RepID=A0A2T5J636_9SPHI|nr:RtcB family protein [Mucilaginibacter yixingensis]PTQ93994.1 tRNA-splicing ligase RtcB [Mucilaginibacter yixingensis]